MSRRDIIVTLDEATELLMSGKLYGDEQALGRILRAAKLMMELAGFDPDERERGQLYRAIVDYIGEDDLELRPLGGASREEAGT